MPEDTTRWTVSVSKDTDIAVRSFLAQRGVKRGDLSKLIEDAVKRRVFDQTLAEARSKFADMPPDELDALISEAVGATRNRQAARAAADGIRAMRTGVTLGGLTVRDLVREGRR